METAFHVFKEHPNWGKMEFILAPLIREKIGITGDIPLANHEWLAAYDFVYRDMFEGKLDCSLLEPLLCRKVPWYFETLLPETQRRIS